MSLSYTAKKNEIPSVYVVKYTCYDNYEVQEDGEVEVHDESLSSAAIYGVYTSAKNAAVAAWNLVSSHEVNDDAGPLESVWAVLCPLDDLTIGKGMMTDMLVVNSEEEALTKIEALKL